VREAYKAEVGDLRTNSRDFAAALSKGFLLIEAFWSGNSQVHFERGLARRSSTQLVHLYFGVVDDAIPPQALPGDEFHRLGDSFPYWLNTDFAKLRYDIRLR
jgi:hypothetical protein